VLRADHLSLRRYLDARRLIVSILRVASKLHVKLATLTPRVSSCSSPLVTMLGSDWRRMTNGPWNLI
jgi:hypothetical protein